MRPLLPPMRRYGTDRPARLPYVNLLVISALLLYFLWRVCICYGWHARPDIRRGDPANQTDGRVPADEQTRLLMRRRDVAQLTCIMLRYTP